MIINFFFLSSYHWLYYCKIQGGLIEIKHQYLWTIIIEIVLFLSLRNYILKINLIEKNVYIQLYMIIVVNIS